MYFCKVIRGVLGTNKELEDAIEEVLKKRNVSLYSEPPEGDAV